MKNRLEHESHGEHNSDTQALGRQETKAFQNAEEVVRADREQTQVPERVAERLADSIAREPHPQRPWWKRWIG